MMIPELVLFVHIVSTSAQFNSNERESLGNTKGQYPDGNRHVLDRVPVNRTYWYPGLTDNEARRRFTEKFINGSEKIINENVEKGDTVIIKQAERKAHEVSARFMDNNLDDSAIYFGKWSNGPHYTGRVPLKDRRRSVDRIRWNSSSSYTMSYNGLPVWSDFKPVNHSKDKLTNRNGDISSVEETTTETIDLTNRMAFIGNNCAAGYAKIFKKCVLIDTN